MTAYTTTLISPRMQPKSALAGVIILWASLPLQRPRRIGIVAEAFSMLVSRKRLMTL